MLSFYFILLLIVLNNTALRGSKFVMTLYAIELGASPLILGILIAISSVVPLFLAIHAGKVSDIVGNKLPIVVGSLGMGLGLILPFIFKSLTSLFVSQILLGFFYLFFHVSIQNFIGSLGTGENRTKNYSLYSLVGAISGFIAPLFVGFSIELFDHTSTYLALTFFAIIPGVALMFVPLLANSKTEVKEKKNTKRENSSFKELLKIAPLRRAFFASGMILTGISLYAFYLPIYGSAIGLSASVIGIIMSCYSISFFIVRVVLPSLVKKLGEEKVLTVSMYVASITFLLFPFTENAYLLSLLSFILGFGLGTGQPLSTVLTYNNSPEGRTGEALGIRLTVNKFTHITVPILFGFIGTTLGFAPVFIGNTILLLLGGIFSRKRD